MNKLKQYDLGEGLQYVPTWSDEDWADWWTQRHEEYQYHEDMHRLAVGGAIAALCVFTLTIVALVVFN